MNAASTDALIAQLPAGIRRPHVSPNDDGEVGLSWCRGADRFEAMIRPDGHLVWVTKTGGKWLPGEDIPWSDPTPLHAALKEFFA